MKYLLYGLERHGIGRRALNEKDFWQICEQQQIEIVWSHEKFPFYFTVPDDDLRVIVLPERLTGIRLLFSMFHELAHHFLHGGDEPCLAFMGLSDHKCEAEADAVALIALFPRVNIELVFHSRFEQRLWSERLRLFFLYGI